MVQTPKSNPKTQPYPSRLPQGLYSQLEASKKALPPAQLHTASQALRPLLQALDACFEYYDRHVAEA